MNKKTTIIVVAIVLVAAVAIAMVISRGGSVSEETEDGDKYTFTDSKGYEHTVTTPLTNVSIVHKYIPIFMKILGEEDQVAGIDSTYGAKFKDYFPNSFYIGNYSEPDGATMLAHGSKVILTPVTMGLSNSDALQQMGIEVIYIDLTDPYVIGDSLEIMVNLFGATSEVEKRAGQYMDLFNECYDFVDKFDFSSTADADFCLYMSSSGFYQTHESSAVKVIESISGRSYTHITDPNVKDTVYFNQSPTVIMDFDGKYGLDYLFLYSMDTPQLNLQKFLDSGNDLDFTKMSCFGNKKVFALSTDCVNGALSCVSLILYAQAFGADVGDKAVQMVQSFNDTFGLHFSTTDLIVQVA